MSEYYASFIAKKYTGKLVEIYVGDNVGTLYYSDFDVSEKAYIVGIVKGSESEAVTVEVEIVTGDGNSHKCEVDIHSWAIKGIMLKKNNGISIMNVFGNQAARKLKR